MSQSPVGDFSEAEANSYRQGWRALNRLLHENRSFSGNERNCAFLNLGSSADGSPRFANASAATAFDFADDGRALATCDWDFDGDLDVWVTNRTAPRVRFLRNNSPAETRSISFKLHGDGIATNRDAIGARLELHLQTPSGLQKRVRTLRGGEGFLSQSSNWIHFALSTDHKIEKLIVRWPGGQIQEFTKLEEKKFYLIDQGKASPRVFTPPKNRVPLHTAPQIVTPVNEIIRTIVPVGLPLPKLEVVDESGKTSSYPLPSSGTNIINLWSSTCAPCVAELSEWTQHREKLVAAGANIMLLNTDHLASISKDRSEVLMKKIGVTFPNESISEQSLNVLDALQRSVLDRWLPLPIPTTIMIGSDGQVVAIYKGPVSASQLLADLPLTIATATERRNAAIPFSGTWVDEKSGPTSPRRLASMLVDHNQIPEAINYLDYSVSQLSNDSKSARELGDIHFMIAILKNTDPNRQAEVIKHLQEARKLLPDDVRVHRELEKQIAIRRKTTPIDPELLESVEKDPENQEQRLQLALQQFHAKDWASAEKNLTQLVTSNPEPASYHYHLANARVRLGKFPEAIDGYRQTLKRSPKTYEAANNLAWILASHPDENIRSASEALELAKRLCVISKESHAQFLDTRGVAQANLGNFPEAIESVSKALALGESAPEAAKAPLRARLKLYEAKQPFRESSWR